MVIQLWSSNDWTNLPQTGSMGRTDPALLPSKMNCSPSSLTPGRRIRFWQPLPLIQATGSMLHPSLPVGCVWTTRQFVLLWLCASDYRCLRSPFLLLRRKRRCLGSACLFCKHASGQTQRHHALNDVIARSFASAEIPVAKEPTGIYRDSANGRTASP